jgi:ParB family chromosome partitioning protein
VSTATKTKTAAKPAKPAAKPANAYAGLGDMLAGGFDSGLTDDANDQMVKLDNIEVVAQVREEFEDDENDLAGLGKSLRKEQIQSILLRPNPAGSAKPYRLVAGERRVRAARVEGLTELRARIKPMTDAEAEDAQFAENVHRKNLTQIEEAKRVQRDLDQLGSVDAVLAKHNKSRAWLSKIIGLLHLPEQAKRLVKENISADVEVINTVKTIEKADPKKAKALVDELKNSRGKTNTRERVAAVKEEVKPSKKDKAAKDTGGTVATPRSRSQEEPGQTEIFAGAKKQGGSIEPAEVLGRAYANIFEFGSSPKTTLDVMRAEDRESVEAWLATFYETGKQAKDAGRAVIQGMRNGQFAADGAGAFALVAFLHGTDGHKKFNLLDVFGCIKP